MTRRLVRSLAAAALALAATQCTSTTEMPDPLSVWVLESVNGDPLPATWVQSDMGRLEIVADTLWLFADLRGEMHQTQRAVPAPAADPGPWHYESEFRYSVSGSAIEIAMDCDDTPQASASCIAPPHFAGQIGTDELRLTFVPQGQELVFRRIPE